MKIEKTRWAVYNINYHLVWIPKYRRPLLHGQMAERLRSIFQEVAEKVQVSIEALEIMPDHIHLFISAPPRYAPAQLVNIFKGVSARYLRRDFPYLRKLHPKSLWTRTYYVGTTGTVSAETIRQYLEEQRAR